MSNKADLKTVKGTIELLEQGVDEIMTDPRPDTIRKWCAVNQLLGTANRTYALALSPQRINAIKLVDQANNHCWGDLDSDGLKADKLSGDILGISEGDN